MNLIFPDIISVKIRILSEWVWDYLILFQSKLEYYMSGYLGQWSLLRNLIWITTWDLTWNDTWVSGNLFGFVTWTISGNLIWVATWVSTHLFVNVTWMVAWDFTWSIWLLTLRLHLTSYLKFLNNSTWMSHSSKAWKSHSSK